ncbi:hypothetical protein Lfu02_55080 [Longispora fulva]|uniref:5-methylcytosine-specific restriction endonuclease McrA n=1 Tax=Longispora fulva TaxID=619741 RepID=A0A8J7KL43_9ACTN|nr:5-methylcytosine-specific restriction endonuclease McrA [Longispora fulva]GIG61136.1 hypothetical protein Lfu02_55080 [Longispora fulva]
MAWDSSDRRAQLPRDWPRRRALVLRRDGHMCQWVRQDGSDELCLEAATDVDHIIPGSDHRLVNLRALCAWHHGRKSGGEGAQAAAAKRTSRYRPREQHPGRLAP